MTTRAEIIEFLAREMPKIKCRIEEVGNGSATVIHDVGPDELRPGGTVSGPVLMTVADVSLYVAILGEIGIVPLAVTTNLSINFLRRPAAGKAIIGVSKLIKLGRVLVVGEILLYSQGAPELVAHAVGTYSIPQRRDGS